MNKLLTTVLAFATVSLAGFANIANAQDIVGDAKAGQAKVDMCLGCHSIVGYQASFPEVHKVPKISGQGAKYIISALNAYKKGDRKHPTMRGIADSLSDQDMADVAAYYSASGVVAGATLPAKPRVEPSAQVATLLTSGLCVSCHGANFSTPTDPTYPKIAGQHADYLYVALKSYQTNSSPVVGRSNGVMGNKVKDLSTAELKALAEYLHSLDGELKVVPQSRFR